jgi:hypothetical protein
MKERICHGVLKNKIACNQAISLAGGWEYTTMPEVKRYAITCKTCLKLMKDEIAKRKQNLK